MIARCEPQTRNLLGLMKCACIGIRSALNGQERAEMDFPPIDTCARNFF